MQPKSSRGVVLLVLCLATFLISIDTTIVNVALPSLVRAIGATTRELQWIVDAYNLVFAALVLAAGSLGDRFGRKPALIAGLAIFAVGAALGGVASTAGQLVAVRAVMGLGAAAIFPTTLSIISNVFPERAARAKAIGAWGATTGLGIAFGPISGGWLLEHFAWTSVFVALAPVAAVIALLVIARVPDSRDPATPPLDLAGLLLSTLAVGSLVYTLIEAPDAGWTSAHTLGGLAASAVGFAAFVARERTAAHPMLDVRLFRNLRFTAASASVTIASFALFGFVFLVTQYFQFLKGYSPLGAGVRLLPVATTVALSSIFGTRLAVRVGTKPVVAAGLALLAVAYTWIGTTAGVDTPYLAIVGQMILLGTGMGLTTAPATESIMGAVPKEKAGIGSAMNDATRQLGGTLGVAVIGSVFASRFHHPLSALASSAAARADFFHGFAAGCLVAAALAALGSLAALRWLPNR